MITLINFLCSVTSAPCLGVAIVHTTVIIAGRRARCCLSAVLGAVVSVVGSGLGAVTLALVTRSRTSVVAFAINLFKRGIAKGETSPLAYILLQQIG